MGPLRELKELSAEDCAAWTAVADYAASSSYQVARALNLAAAVPAPPAGYRWEFGARAESDGTSTLLVRMRATS